MIQEIRTVLTLYQNREVSNEQLYFLVKHYAENFGYLLFEDDYKIHSQFGRILGKRNTHILETIIKEIKQEKQEEQYGCG